MSIFMWIVLCICDVWIIMHMWHLTLDLEINVTRYFVNVYDIWLGHCKYFTWITRIFIVIVINVFYRRRVNQSLSAKEMIWLMGLLCICCNVYSVRMNVRVVCLVLYQWDVCATNMAIYFLSGGNEMETSRFSVIITGIYLCSWNSQHWLQSIETVIENSSTVFSIYYWRKRIRIITHI